MGYFVIKIYSLSELFLLGFVIEGFYAQNEKNKQIDVEEIKDLCNKVFVSIYTVYIWHIYKEEKYSNFFFRTISCEVFHQICFYLRKFCRRKSHDLCTLFGHLIRLLWRWSLALMYLTAGILNTNVCGYHPLTYLFNVYKLNRNSISGNVFNIIQAAYGFLSIFSYQYKELEMNPPFLFMAFP